ncbi:hypothetical protein NA78x_004329 [Anatilimnocola sp. NA78]|uniref:hypothetical protein n=1 Tax=Anatilimnocola sp. NA78 TaxID=3415683 RepID=UPI003CE52B23
MTKGNPSGSQQARPTGAPQAATATAPPANARAILQATLPDVLKLLTLPQVTKVQRVLDAAVNNPAIEKEAQALYRDAIKVYGSLVVKDPAKIRRYEQKRSKYISIGEADKRIKLDHEALLESDALKPRTDNPDEANYLLEVRKALKNRGVYLRMAAKLVRDPEDKSRHIIDPRQWEVWLSLGPDGDYIPTKNGKLTRDSIMGTTVLGAGYYTAVHNGPMQRKLKNFIQKLGNDIDSGIETHNLYASIRRQAFPGVPAVADKVGGATFPSRKPWDDANKLLLRALELNVSGNVHESMLLLMIAALLIEGEAKKLHTYIERTTSGAESMVKVLTVVRDVAIIIESCLVIGKVVQLARGVAAATQAVRAKSTQQLAAEFLEYELKRNPGLAKDLSTTTVEVIKTTAQGTVRRGGASGAGNGMHTGW